MDCSAETTDASGAHLRGRLILASASPRRREIMRKWGLAFEVVPSSAEPAVDHYTTAEKAARTSAEAKALDIAARRPQRLVVGADTVVSVAGQILGKPRDHDHAWQMLSALSGATHEVHTGVALALGGNDRASLLDSRVACTEVTFRTLSEQDIDWYIATGEPFDKAGGYGIQGQGGNLIAGFSGSYYNVVGLPIEMLLEMLRDAGWRGEGHPGESVADGV